MRSIRLIAPILVLLLAASAEAALYHTSMLKAGAAQKLFCWVSNVGTKPAKVSVTLFDLSGADVSASASDTCALNAGVLDPGRTCSIALGGPTTELRCSVNATGKVRVLWSITDGGNNALVVVPATK